MVSLGQMKIALIKRQQTAKGSQNMACVANNHRITRFQLVNIRFGWK